MAYKLEKRKGFDRYQQLVEQSPVAICIQHGDKIVFINAAGLKFFGAKNQEQIIGRSITEFVGLNYRQFLDRQFQEVIEEGKAIAPFEEKLIQMDGNELYVEMEATPFHYNGKSAVQIVFRDLTIRNEIRELLFQSKHDWADTFNNITDMITVHDKDFNIIHANKAAKKILNLPLLEESIKKLSHCFGVNLIR